VPEDWRRRRLLVDGNTILPAAIDYEVCGEGADPGMVNFFRVYDPLAAWSIDDMIAPGEELSTRKLAFRIAGQEETGSPPGEAMRSAAMLREAWGRAGLVRLFDGSRRAKMLHRSDRSATDPDGPDR